MTRHRGILYVAGVLVFAGPLGVWLATSMTSTAAENVEAPVELVAHESSAVETDREVLARQNPMALVRLGRQWYEKNVDAYQCTFIKQELVDGELSDVQEIEVRYRENPHSVYMLWKRNEAGARRALYIDSPEHTNKKGEKLTRVEPAGAVARLFTKDIKLPVHGKQAQEASRRPITDFGFEATLDLLEQYNSLAEQKGVLSLHYAGTGTVDERPTYVIVRDLPYESDPELYPDARMVLHLDQEWLLPVAVYSYADRDEQTLLGSYVYTDVDFTPEFDESSFRF